MQRGRREIKRGAEIMRGYEHPDDWMDGANAVRRELRACMVLRVQEIQYIDGRRSYKEAEANGKAICAWARSVGIRLSQLSCDWHPEFTAYVRVAKRHWDEVLEKLQTLNT